MQRATDTMLDAQDFMRHALWQHASCSGRNSKQQIACNMQQATRSMQQTSRRE
jgi:3-hydroxy-3-methylglutaryl CoA synthase